MLLAIQKYILRCYDASWFSTRDQFNSSEEDARSFLTKNNYKPKVFSFKNIAEFFKNIPTVIKTIYHEPEILFFIFLQWVTICLAYFAWVQILKWIPDQIWNAIAQASEENRKTGFYLINLLLLGWSFLIVCAASYPISICNAAIVAVHDLRTSKEKVTFGKCLAIATCHIGKIWTFTTIDAWITVLAILDRLPRKHGHRTLRDEIAYYTWKIATVAVVPSLVNGRQIFQAGNDSIVLLTKQPARTLGIRLGYSAVCWVIGLLTYVGSFFVFAKYGSTGREPHYIYNFYFLMAAPIVVAVGVIAVLVRPFYLLSVAKLYTDLIDVRAEVEKDISHIPKWETFLLSWKTIVFILLLTIIVVAIFWGDQLGLTDWINHIAQSELLRTKF